MTDPRESTGMGRECAFVVPLCQKTEQTVAWPVVADKEGERGLLEERGGMDSIDGEALGCMWKPRWVIALELYLLFF